MQINVETKPVTNSGYDARKKRLVDTIDRLYHRDAKASLQKLIARLHPADMAAILDDLPTEHVTDIFHSIPDHRMAADVLGQLSEDLRNRVTDESPIDKLARVLEGLPPDDLADIMGKLPEELRTQLMALLGRESKDELENLLQYDPDSAGGIMTTDFFSLPHTMTVEEAVANIRRRTDVEMIFYLYLTDEAGCLVGVVSMRQ